MYGLHFSEVLNGRLFSQAATPLGLAIPIYTATGVGGGIPLWNPPGSNVTVEMVSYDIDYGSGTSVYGAIGVMALPLNALGGLCTALADTVPINGYLGGGQASKVKSSNAGTTTVTAGVVTNPYSAGATAPGWVRSLADINLEAVTATPQGTGVHTYVFNGTLCVPPGNMIYLAATLATVALFATTMVWKEWIINPAIS